jgi:D-arabinose 1-dehydrogenase-like Zn-dependent alcohol dehydrogenase
MKALFIRQPGEASIGQVSEPQNSGEQLLLQVRMVGLCGSDLNSFRGKNPLVSFPRIPGHEVAATIVSGSKTDSRLATGVNVTMSPYTSWASARRAAAEDRMPVNTIRRWGCSVMAR